MIDNQPKKTKAYIAGVNLNDPNFDYYMTELANLTEADNMEVVGQSYQNAESIVAGTYFGVGKINEIRTMAQGLKAKVLVLNDELTPVQIRNLEKLTKMRVIDRTELILKFLPVVLALSRPNYRCNSPDCNMSCHVFTLPRTTWTSSVVVVSPTVVPVKVSWNEPPDNRQAIFRY